MSVGTIVNFIGLVGAVRSVTIGYVRLAAVHGLGAHATAGGLSRFFLYQLMQDRIPSFSNLFRATGFA